jgi:hypothetical protein
MKDPLAGMRRAIAERKLKVLRWPADKDCPVEKGQMFEVGSIKIEIETINRKLLPGKQAEWHVTFIRHEPDRYYFLRQAPPVHAGSEKDLDLDLSATERARRDGSYTSSKVAASPGEPETVGPDWEDPNSAERELWRHDARREIERKRMEQEAKSRLGRLLRGSTPEQAQVILAQVELMCQQVEEKSAA